jgi:DNA primase
LRLLKRYTRKIVLALDPDAAGQKAVLRGLDAAREAMDREGELRFDARGLLRNEARLQADLRVASLPDGLDPDEIIARDPAEWAGLIADARPVVTHVMETLAGGQDLNDPKVKSQIAAQVVPLIEDLPDPIERDTYRQRLARFLKVDERSLTGAPVRRQRVRRAKPRLGAGERPVVEAAPVVTAVSPSHKTELYCLGVLLHRPELLHQLDRKLQESDLQRLVTDDFRYTDHQVLFDLIQKSLEQDEEDHHRFIVENIPAALDELAHELLDQTGLQEIAEQKILEELKRKVRFLRRNVVDESIQQIRFFQEEAQQAGDFNSVKEYIIQMNQLTVLRNKLDRVS